MSGQKKKKDWPELGFCYPAFGLYILVHKKVHI